MRKEKKEEAPRVLKNVFHEPVLETEEVKEKTELDKFVEVYDFLVSRGINDVSKLEVLIANLKK